jgi:hypothetical protein
VTVTGRVLTPNERGLRNATVTATDTRGTTHTALTCKRGVFILPELDAGETYIFSVISRRYVYSPLVMTLNDTLYDLNFVPDSTQQRTANRR